MVIQSDMIMYFISHQVQQNAVKQYCINLLSFIANKSWWIL